MVLAEEQRNIVRNIVQSTVPGAKLWIFGSRATGHARPYSDLDLLLTYPTRLTWLQRVTLKDAFESSDLPFCVDVVESGTLAPAVASRVEQEKVALGDA
jgi:predicted nucleotidyltransferase